MLGKTNITTLSESGIVTEIEDYRWVQMQSEIYSDFVRAFYKNGYLSAITADGQVAYTADGETWQRVDLQYEGVKINDIDWDGKRFVLVGCYTDLSIAEDDTTGIAVTTTDFKVFSKLPMIAYGAYNGNPTYYNEYVFAVPMNGKYVVAARYGKGLYGVTAEFAEGEMPGRSEMGMGTSFRLKYCTIARNSAGALAYIHKVSESQSGTSSEHRLYTIRDNEIKLLSNFSQLPNVRAITPLECKDVLYFQNLLSNNAYALNKVTGSGEILTVTTGQDFAFTGAVYFSGCQLFINAHEMLVVHKGENLSDKTVEDLMEIAPEMTMQCIVRAFDQLYIFGGRGLILRSSVETDNEEVIAVQTLSAKRALAEAKAYADEKCAALEARIAALGG